MIAYPDIDPVAFELGPAKIHWYGLMYLFGFAAAWWLGHFRAKDPRRDWSGAAVDDLLFYIALGVIGGGRLGSSYYYLVVAVDLSSVGPYGNDSVGNPRPAALVACP